MSGRDGDRCATDLPFGKSEIFFILGLDTISENQKRFAPSGKSPILIFGSSAKPQSKKYFAFSESQIRAISTPIPSRQEGRRPSSRTRDGLRWTWRCLDDRHRSVRQRRVVPTPRCWCQASCGIVRGSDGGKRAVLRGELVISRKAIAQGMSDVLRCPVCSCAHSLCTLRMRPRVQRASGIPCAL